MNKSKHLELRRDNYWLYHVRTMPTSGYKKSGPSPGLVFEFGTKSRETKLPRDFNDIFCARSGNHGTETFRLYGIQQPRD